MCRGSDRAQVRNNADDGCNQKRDGQRTVQLLTPPPSSDGLQSGSFAPAVVAEIAPPASAIHFNSLVRSRSRLPAILGIFRQAPLDHPFQGRWSQSVESW